MLLETYRNSSVISKFMTIFIKSNQQGISDPNQCTGVGRCVKDVCYSKLIKITVSSQNSWRSTTRIHSKIWPIQKYRDFRFYEFWRHLTFGGIFNNFEFTYFFSKYKILGLHVPSRDLLFYEFCGHFHLNFDFSNFLKYFFT